MIIGLCAGVMYALGGFGPQGSHPRLAFTCGPIRGGHLHISGWHVHHWVVYAAVVAPLAMALGWWNMVAFSCVMIAHGLSYEDRFDFNAAAVVDAPPP
jgi:hypothetical protein